MDYTTTRLADEMMVPHSMIVKKVKKYAGANKNSSGGTIYQTSNKKRLSIVKLGMVNVDGKKETIYQFSKEAYDRCCKDEARFYESQRSKSKDRGAEGYEDSALKRFQDFEKKATAKQMSEYKAIDNSTDAGKDKRRAYIKKVMK